jgi:hypothetical protein
MVEVVSPASHCHGIVNIPHSLFQSPLASASMADRLQQRTQASIHKYKHKTLKLFYNTNRDLLVIYILNNTM